jgi:hypothetical protein
MTDILKLARDAKASAYVNRHFPGVTYMTFSPEALERFADMIRAHQEPVHQWAAKGCEWYDGHPDHEDGGGPYRVRTLYRTSPPDHRDALLRQALEALESCIHGEGDGIRSLHKVCGDAIEAIRKVLP